MTPPTLVPDRQRLSDRALNHEPKISCRRLASSFSKRLTLHDLKTSFHLYSTTQIVSSAICHTHSMSVKCKGIRVSMYSDHSTASVASLQLSLNPAYLQPITALHLACRRHYSHVSELYVQMNPASSPPTPAVRQPPATTDTPTLASLPINCPVLIRPNVR